MFECDSRSAFWVIATRLYTRKNRNCWTIAKACNHIDCPDTSLLSSPPSLSFGKFSQSKPKYRHNYTLRACEKRDFIELLKLQKSWTQLRISHSTIDGDQWICSTFLAYSNRSGGAAEIFNFFLFSYNIFISSTRIEACQLNKFTMFLFVALSQQIDFRTTYSFYNSFLLQSRDWMNAMNGTHNILIFSIWFLNFQ